MSARVTGLERIVQDLWDDRVGFVKHIIGVTPTDQQAEALIALDKHNHVTIASGHGCGKSTIEAWAVQHYMACRPFPKVPCTAPSKHQLFDVLWAELSKWHRRMNAAISSNFSWTKEKYFHLGHPEEWFAVARTATKENPEALQGFHADYVLRVIDEASGVPEAIFEVAEGAHGAIETKELMCANPTRLQGTFYDSHHKLAQFYKRLIWSCLNSPIVPKGYAERIERKFGKQSNIYRVRVLGLFPTRADDAFIPYELAEAALCREIPAQEGRPKVFGVDVARYGDDSTVIAIRHGDEFKPYHVLKNKSTMEVAGYVARLADKEKPRNIFIDVIGIGAGVYDRLSELEYPVIAVNVAESPAINGKDYRRLRDELWGNMRTWLETRRGKLWDTTDGDLIGELTAPRFKILSDGRYQIESKDDMKKRNLPSPNIADAHNMTFALPDAEYTQEKEFLGWTPDSHADGYQPLDPEAGY